MRHAVHDFAFYFFLLFWRDHKDYYHLYFHSLSHHKYCHEENTIIFHASALRLFLFAGCNQYHVLLFSSFQIIFLKKVLHIKGPE